MFRLPIAAGIIVFLGITQSARAQVPFFFPGANAFTPEISVVNTGAILDAQAVVSADRKYVTINARPTNSALLALNNFTFQNGPALGFVGDPRPLPPVNTGVDGSRAGNNPATAVRTSPSEILRYAKSQASLLHHDGMTRVSRLKN
ncbi:MAG TPA: hypothetical protein VG326_20125 [Tepidisphaeraceae bacterium]|jgi:hypothetical protein|nr:hypothetical protein [Tepidisphaeraceae bacterium]